jgi:hypothetical protein
MPFAPLRLSRGRLQSRFVARVTLPPNGCIAASPSDRMRPPRGRPLRMAAHPTAPFEVHAYDLPTLVRLTAKLSRWNSEDAVSSKSHPAYLDSYFTALKVRTIVVEPSYVDRDYLEDFAYYYVRCYEPYERYCSRLHFFSEAFDETAFQAVLSGGNSALTIEVLKQSYCGFIVIKPLPQTVFGRTCLKTYPVQDGRVFPVTRSFAANLFGIPLNIADTLPFQEQDNVVAACATSALWSVLQGTAKEFQHAQLTPIDITRAATEMLPAESRMIPNRGGLSTAMMAEAIRAVGLEPLTLDVPENDGITLRAALYAYLHARIPVILGVRLCDTASGEIMGDHAVAVTGFKLADAPAEPLTGSGFRLLAARIQKIYAHDDQVGPFARMEFDGHRIEVELGDGRGPVPVETLSTSWRNGSGTIDQVRAAPLIVLVPLYHKIRIPYEDIIQVVMDFHKFLTTAKPLNELAGAGELEWDIHLTTVNDLKSDLQSCQQLKGEPRLRWLTQGMPRFLWRATALSGAQRVLDVFLDATDIHTSERVHGVLVYDDELAAVFELIANHPRIDALTELPGALRILRSLKPPAA